MVAVTALSARRSSRPIAAPPSSGGGDHPNLGEAIVARRTPAGERRDVDTVAHQLAGLAPPMWSSPADPTTAPAVDVWSEPTARSTTSSRPGSTRACSRVRVHVRSRDGCGPCSRRGCGRRDPSGEGVRHGSAAGLAVGRSRWGRPGCPLDLRVSGPVLAESVASLSRRAPIPRHSESRAPCRARCRPARRARDHRTPRWVTSCG